MAQTEPRLTAGEKTRAASLVARMCKRGIAGDDVDISDLTNRHQRIIDGAAERTAREQGAMRVELDMARREAATAKTALRTADRTTRADAKNALRAAEDALRRTERAARRIGL